MAATTLTLYDRIVSSVPAENLPFIEKTGLTLVQGFHNAIPGLEFEIAKIAEISKIIGAGMSDEDQKRIDALYDKIDSYTSSAKFLETTDPPHYMHYRLIKNDSMKQLLVQVEDEMTEIFLHAEDKKIYILVGDIEYVPLPQTAHESESVWIRESHKWRKIL